MTFPATQAATARAHVSDTFTSRANEKNQGLPEISPF